MLGLVFEDTVNTFALLALIGLCLAPTPVRAARPLLEQHQWDRYFALSARDVEAPWKPATVRLATYSGAPVDFAVYNVDPAEVILAGRQRSARAIDTRGRRPLARWRFHPPMGYRFEVSRVEVPLGSQEGFYVVEAHRGNAVQQVWINRTHIGLVTKESVNERTLWCTDLRSGRALRNVNIAFLVGRELVSRQTDAHGIVVWKDRARPIFALADHGSGRAFVSFLPQAPLPSAMLGVRLESAAARTGQSVRFIGFARKRVQQTYRPSGGDVRVTLLEKGKPLVQTVVHSDDAGAFTGSFTVPAGIASGDYVVLSALTDGRAVGGTSLHVDAGASVLLAMHTHPPLSLNDPLGVSIVAQGADAEIADLPVAVRVIRSPHVIAPGEADDLARWGTTVVYEKTVRTDARGVARIALLAPTDGLASSYGISVKAGGSTTTTRVTVSDSTTALSIEPDAEKLGLGDAAGFSLRGFDASAGVPTPGLHVHVSLAHGPVSRERETVLDAHGRAHVIFPQTALGTNLAFARAHGGDGRSVSDVTSITVDPGNRSSAGAGGRDASWDLTTDRARYRPGDRITVTAKLPGASGDALITLEGERVYETRVVPIHNERVVTQLHLLDVLGDVRIAVAAVREGALVVDAVSPLIDAPGRERAIKVDASADHFSPGEQATFTVSPGDASASTLLARLSDGRESASAYFDDAPDLLNLSGVTTQNPASADPAWHAFVTPAGSLAADIYAAERPREQSAEDVTLGAAAPRTLGWRLERGREGKITVRMPQEPGTYVLSVLCVRDDGGVGASSINVNVR